MAYEPVDARKVRRQLRDNGRVGMIDEVRAVVAAQHDTHDQPLFLAVFVDRIEFGIIGIKGKGTVSRLEMNAFKRAVHRVGTDNVQVFPDAVGGIN